MTTLNTPSKHKIRPFQPMKWTFFLLQYFLLLTEMPRAVGTRTHNKRQTPMGVCLLSYCVKECGLVGQLCLEVLAVETSDVADAYALGALSLAGTCVGAVTEA